MTVSTLQAQSTFLGTGSQTSFGFSFNNGVPFNSNTSLASYSVTYTAANGAETLLSTTSYSITFNAALPGSLWGLGGNLIYPLVGSPIASGTMLTLQRSFPLQQLTSISDQGDFAPQNIEAMGDLLEMQLQQIGARTTQFRGTWLTGTKYYYGDIVQDGANGSDTLNYYICLTANTSSVWLTDLTAGDWGVSALAAVPTGNLTLVGAVIGSGASPITTTLATVNSNIGAFTNASITVNAEGLVTAASSGSAAGGTVTSVTYTGDGVLQSSTPSAAVTTTGTVSAALIAQAKNTVLAGPVSGSNAIPTFRSIVSADIPASLSLVTPLLGTPTSGNLVNCTGIPVSLMTAGAVGSIITAKKSTAGAIAAGSTAAAADLTVTTISGNVNSQTITGTWTCLVSQTVIADITIWQRTA